jgi:hypothetical protein
VPRKTALLVLLALAALPRAAQAEGGAYRLFLAGTSEGEPSTPKTVTTVALYGASALNLGASAYFFVDWQSVRGQRSSFNQLEPNACANLGSSECARASELDSDTNRSFNLGFGALAAGVTLAVSGIFLAEAWPNTKLEPSVAFSPEGAFVATALRF